MVTYLGRRVVTYPDAGWGQAAAGEMRTTNTPAAAGALWVYQLGGHIGPYVSGQTVTLAFAAYALDGNGNPAARRGKTASFTSAVQMADNSSGESREINVETPFLLASGAALGLGALGTAVQWAHGQDNSGATMYFRSGLAQPPPDPNGYTSSSPQGTLSLWAVCQANSAPNTPTTGLAHSGTITTLTPTFTANFSDPDETLPGFAVGTADKLARYRINVRRVSDQVSFWSTDLAASGGEQTARAMSVVYGGTALVAGVAYEWQVGMQDLAGAWSAWSAWTSFTINAGGVVTTNGTPSGKQLTQTPGPFQYRWTHASGLALQNVQIRLLQNNVVVSTSANIAKTTVSSASPGTLDSVTWAQTGFATLAWGQGYSYQVQGQDSGGVWSDWSTARTFTTDAVPNTPTNLSPANGTATTSLPLLKFQLTDPDNTPGAGGLTAQVRIKNSAGSLLFTRTPTYNSTSGYFEYQTTSTDFASFATYKWDARGYDGTLYGAYSAEYSVVYGSGPVVTVNTPTEAQAVTTTTPSTSWTVTSGGPQAKYQVQLYDGTGDALLYDTGTITSLSTLFTYPGGYLHNGGSYYEIITITNSVPLSGSSAQRNFTVSLTPPAAVTGFSASPALARFDRTVPSAARLTWNQTTYPSGSFGWYAISRRPASDPAGGTTDIVLVQLTSPTTVAWIDYLPASGIQYTYSLRQSIYQGTDPVASNAVEATTGITLDGSVLCDPLAGGDRRVVLRYAAARAVAPLQDQTLLSTWGDKPLAVLGVSRWDQVTGTFWLGGDATDPENGAAYATALRTLVGLRPDQTPVIVCYRDERGRKFFGVIAAAPADDARVERYAVSLTLTEVAFTEGV